MTMPAQERNTQHPGSSPEVSRLSAAARKKLGTLGVSLDRLARALDTAPLADSLWVAMLACACMCGGTHAAMDMHRRRGGGRYQLRQCRAAENDHAGPYVMNAN